MNKVRGVLIPPQRSVRNCYDHTQNNQIVLINNICMFGFVGEVGISFALLGGHTTTWKFESEFDCGRAMAGIYDQLGVIE